jgi:hypothetical protein
MPNKPVSPQSLALALAKPRWTEAHATEIVAAWRASKLTCRAFAEAHGIDPQRLSRWAKQLSSPTFAEVFLVDEPARSNAAVIIELGQARVIVDHDVDGEHLARVLRVVGSVC